MSKNPLEPSDCLGLIRPLVDAHNLGITSLSQLLKDCGIRTVIADAAVCEAFGSPGDPRNAETIIHWIRTHGITALGFSYRLGPDEGCLAFVKLTMMLKSRKLLTRQGGPIRSLYFAGLPSACEMVRARYPEVTAVFPGEETPADTLTRLGIDTSLLPSSVSGAVAYDEDRLSFGRELVRTGSHLGIGPAIRANYPGFGSDRDSVQARVHYHIKYGLMPLIRAHVGPYGPKREETVRQFLEWTRTLALSGLLDVLSIGTSQLTQSNFGEQWGDLPNGGGVPLNSKTEFESVWHAARPMLVRTYAGTRNIPDLARMYEETIHIAWHALSLWWFCRIDGRGPHSVDENLREQIETLHYVAATGKPYEPNISHHFAFRGADDVTYVVSAVLAARLAKRLGIGCLILQNMLNTPKYTWGIQDLAKSRALLQLTAELMDKTFSILLQPRGGLDYFSTDPEKAKAQLAAVTALMDDIEPHNATSPQIIHVVSYSEASQLADPGIINESIQITIHALKEWRRLRRLGWIDDMSRHKEVMERTEALVNDARTVLAAIHSRITDPYSAEGLYRIFSEGYLPVPYLWGAQDEFRKATAWQTRVIRGGVQVVDHTGNPISAAARMLALDQNVPACFPQTGGI